MKDVIFITVKTNGSKLLAVNQIVLDCFEKKRKLLISVQDERAAHFLDDFLWKNPKESFLPHRISNENCIDPIVITTEMSNLNDATVALNLCETVPAFIKNFPLVYDLLDHTTSKKQAFSEERLTTYQKEGFNILVK